MSVSISDNQKQLMGNIAERLINKTVSDSKFKIPAMEFKNNKCANIIYPQDKHI